MRHVSVKLLNMYGKVVPYVKPDSKTTSRFDFNSSNDT